MRTESTLRTGLLRLALLLCLVLGACSSGEPEQDEDATVAPPPRDGNAHVIATDYAFGGIPSQMETGAELTLSNHSAEEVHEIVAFKLPDGEDRLASELVELPQAELERALGGPPVTVLVALPGQQGQTVEGNGTLSAAGRYVFLCLIPVGADPAAYEEAIASQAEGPPDVAGGPPHFTRGMYAEARVG